MEPLTSAALISGGLSIFGGKKQNKAQIASAREQMAFQERMSNTSHQRQVEDLKKAGINPILSARLGGASVPSGAQPNIRNEYEGAATSAKNLIAAKTATAQIDNIKSQTNLNNAQSAVAVERAKTEAAMQGNLGSQTAFNAERLNTQKHLTEQERIRIETAMATMSRTKMDALTAGAQATRAILQENIDQSGAGQVLSWMQRANEIGLGVRDAMRLLATTRRSPRLPSLSGQRPKNDSGRRGKYDDPLME